MDSSVYCYTVGLQRSARGTKNRGATPSPRSGMLGFHLTPVSASGSGDTAGARDGGNAASTGFFGGGPGACMRFGAGG